MKDLETGRIDEDHLGEKQVLGYADRWSAAPGEEIEFMVSCLGVDEYRADIVKLVCGDTNPAGPGYKENIVSASVNGEYPGRTQTLETGSYVRIDDDRLGFADGFSLAALVYPTDPHNNVQGLLTKWDEYRREGYGLFIDGGTPALWLGDGSGTAVKVSTESSFVPSTWYFVAATYDPTNSVVRLVQRPVSEETFERQSPKAKRHVTVEREIGFAEQAVPDVPFVMAGAIRTSDEDEDSVVSSFDGKLEQPTVLDRPLSFATLQRLSEEPLSLANEADILASWDFAEELGPDGVSPPSHITDRGPHGMDGESVNMPARAVPGHNWTGDVHDYRSVPDQYGAIHFHRDDLTDAGWDIDFTWQVPDETESGVYAARLRTDADEFYVTFAVRPPVGTPSANVLLLLPTNSYLAYANHQYGTDAPFENGFGLVPTLDDGHLFKNKHRECGLSLYDIHPDGHGSMYSSRLRPIVNVSSPKATYGGAPPSHLHQLAADLYIVDWLEELGISYDVATDEDLHEEGIDLLSPYNCVLSGHHAEYYSRDQLDMFKNYQDNGGRFVYLSGNGFYWSIAYHPDNSRLIEIRRGGEGNTPWFPSPGERYHAFDGKKGGTWRELGRPPQELVGVGYAAQWDSKAGYYRRNADSYEPAVDFIFRNVDDEVIGDFGLLGGGAAGGELDRYDPSLGSPQHAYVLASSEGHTEYMKQVADEWPHPEGYLDARMNPKARADLVYYRTPNNGAVFSVGSMNWVGSLSHNEYDNNVSRILENVVRRFASDEPLPADSRFGSSGE
jgi:N,N-dimethylformamidase